MPELFRQYGYPSFIPKAGNDLKRIERMIAENTDIIINRWYELFKTDNEDNQ